MIASLLQQTKRSAEHVTALTRIANTISTDKNVLLLFEEASTLLLQGSNEKIQGYFIINRLLNQDITSLEGRLCALIDRIPTLLQHATEDEIDNLCVLVDGLAEREVLYHRLEKQLPRLIQSTTRRIETSLSAYHFLHVLLKHFGKATVVSSHGNKLQRVLLPLLLQPAHAAQAAHAIADMYCYTNSDHWISSWNRHVQDLLHCLTLLSLPCTPPSSTSAFSFAEQLSQHQSTSRVLVIERCVKASVLVLMQMLAIGCGSGAVVTDYTHMVGMLRTVLAYHNVINDDSKNLIENEAGISLASLALVMPNLKMYMWSLYSAMLESQHLGIKRFSYDLCKCIASAFALPDALSELSLHAFELAITNFPLTMIQVASSTIELVVSKFESAVEAMTVLGTSVDLVLTKAVLGAISTLLLHASPLLPIEVRTQIEQCYSRLLLCLLKGVMPRQRSVEVLRTDDELQMIVLRSAAVEAQAVNKDGVISGNIGLFRRFSCVYTGRHRSEVAMLACGVNAILHPAAVCIPSCNISQVVQQAILKRKRDELEAPVEITINNNDETEIVPAEVMLEASTARTAANTTTTKPTHEISDTVKNFQYRELKPQKIAKKASEDSGDDFDLPEINIDAKPDKR